MFIRLEKYLNFKFTKNDVTIKRTSYIGLEYLYTQNI